MATAKLRGVLTLDSSPFYRSIRQSMAFSRAAALQFARSPFRTTAIIGGLAGGAAVKGISAGLVGMAGVGVKAFKVLGIGALAAGAAIAFGVKKAFDLGGAMYDLSLRTGASVGNLLILNRAFEDAGVSGDNARAAINKMQKALSGVNEDGDDTAGVFAELGLSAQELSAIDPAAAFMKVGAAIASIQDPAKRTAVAMKLFGRSGGELLSVFRDAGAFKEAAATLGAQAVLLEKNAQIFDKISDQLGHAGTKLQGFFVGVADRVASTISPMLDRLEKIDLAGMGQKFGDGLTTGISALVGAFKDPQEFGNFIADGFDYGAKIGGNILIAVFAAGLEFFKDGFIATISGIGQIIIATLTDAFATPIALFQAGIEAGIEKASNWAGVATANAAMSALNEYSSPEEVQAAAAAVKEAEAKRTAPGKTISERAQEIKEEGVRFGLGKGKTSDEWREEGKANIERGMGGARRAARGFKVNDVLGASESRARASDSLGGLVRAGSAGVARNVQPFQPPGFPVAAMPKIKTNPFAGFTTANMGGAQVVRTIQPTGGLQSGGQSDKAFGLVRRGDAARKKAEAESSKGKDDPVVGAIDGLKSTIDNPAWVKE